MQNHIIVWKGMIELSILVNTDEVIGDFYFVHLFVHLLPVPQWELLTFITRYNNKNIV